MSEGTIKRLTDKGFGFISNASGTDLFFHMSAVEGVRFEELREGQKVSYNEGRGPKGPRAENVRVIGSALAGMHYLDERCGDGVALASAHRAAASLVSKRAVAA